MPRPEPHPCDVAIVGIGCLFPKAPSLQEYWRNTLGGVDAITAVPEGHSWKAEDYYDADPTAPDKTWATRGGFLERYPFDPLQFGIPPAMLESIDTTQLLSLIVAREALRDAGIDPDGDGWDRERVACIVGITGTQEMAITAGSRLQGPLWRRSLLRCGVDPALTDVIVRDIANHFPTWTEQTFPGLLGNVVAGRIANRLDLGGTNAVVDAACASSLAAMQYAISDLTSGRSDLVLTGGADTLNDIFMFECFTRTPAFTKKGDPRPFDASADGILIGEGIALTALKRLEDAERDGDRVYAVIKAIGSSSDGRYKSIYAPNPDGQAKALRRTYATAGVEASTIELVEAHGTGTKAGDAAEIEALKRVYREARPEGRWVAIGSVKAQIGHTKSTAGAAGLVKAALALRSRIIPPAAKIDQPNPKMGFEDSPFYLSPRPRPWIRAADHPRRAAVSAFGFGGSNFHAVLEEHGSAHVAALAPAGTELFLVGADDDAGLLRAVEGIGGLTLAHAARAAHAAWTPGRARVAAFVATSLDQLPARVEAIRRQLRGEPVRPKDDAWVGGGPPAGGLMLLFPGQGSQMVEMGRDLAVRYPQVREALDEADEVFRQLGLPALSSRTFPPTAWSRGEEKAQEEALRATEWAQPALGAHAMGVAAQLALFGLAPDAVAGHSYGELPALWAAGVLGDSDLVRLSRARGDAMAGESGDRGTMAAVDGPLAAIEGVVAGIEGVVVANRNHPTQAVISGAGEAVERAVAACAVHGLQTKALRVSAAFHSPLMEAGRPPFREVLAKVAIEPPRCTVLSCRDGAPWPTDPDAVRDRLADALIEPVDFVAVVEGAWERGVRTFVEVGPRSVLCGLVEATLGDRRALVLSTDRSSGRDDGDADLKRLLARLATAGHPVDLGPLLAEAAPVDPPRPTPRTVWLAGANHRNPETLEPPMPKLPTPPTAPAPAFGDGWGAVPSSGRPMEKPVHLEVDRSPAAPTTLPTPVAPAPASAASAEVLALLESTRATLAAFQDAQARTADVHARFLDGFARANENFARLFEAQARLVEQVAGLQPSTRPALPAYVPTPAPAPVAPPVPVAPAIAAPQAPEVGRVSLPNADRPSVATDLPPIFDALAAVNAKAEARVSAPATVPLTRTGPGAVTEAMLDAVAAKTGYPRDALELSMDMEADLGIDSIKRVEILSAVREKVPGLPEMDNEALGAMRTLDEVVKALAATTGAVEVAPMFVPHKPPSRDTLIGALLEAVASKTGYPRDALEMSMDLESDLGVDSIKRVEILSAVRDRIPELPELDNEALGALRTLSDVADHLGGVAAGLGFALIGSDPREASTPALLVPPAADPLPPAPPAPGLPPVQSFGELARDDGPLDRRFLRRRSVLTVPAPERVALTPTGPIAMTTDADGFAARVAEALRKRGAEVVTLDDPRAVPAGCWGVVHASAIGATDVRASVRDGFVLARAMGRVDRFLTLSDLYRGRPLVGALGGLAKTVARELAGCRATALDLATTTTADQVADEILGWRGVEELRMDGLLTAAESHTPEPAGPFPLSDGDLVVITGGARGVTAACAIALARRVKASFLLLGRSAVGAEPAWAEGATDAELVGRRLAVARTSGQRIKPREAEAEAARVRAGREARATLSAIAAAGCSVRYHPVDGRDAAGVAEAVRSAVVGHGPVRAVVHGMGVLADKRMQDKTDEQFDTVFGTKWDGLHALLAAVDPAELRVLAAFTSVAGRYGNVGQVDYAMANEALVHALLDHQGRHPTCRVKAFDWGPWDGGMVDASLRAVFEQRGHGVIPLSAGADLFVDELSRPEPEVVVEAALPVRGARALVVDPSSPWMRDHRVDRRPVLPLAMAVEWMAALVRDVAPERSLLRLEDVRVLRPVKPEAPTNLLLGWERLGDRVVLELRAEDGSVHQRATAVLGAPVGAERFGGSNGLGADPLDRPLYGDWLFHGPSLQALSAIRTSARGAVAHMRTSAPADLGEVGVSWATDPVCVDGALQLLLVWVRHTFGTAALPMALTFEPRAPLQGEVYCHLVAEPGASATAGRFRADLVSADERVLATLRGEYATTPSLLAAFRNEEARP